MSDKYRGNALSANDLADRSSSGIGRKIQKGENKKIDRINYLVQTIIDNPDNHEALLELWSLYRPLTDKLIGKWNRYYKEHTGLVYDFDELLSECFYWFKKYVLKYDFGESERGKRATFGVYIKKMMDARIRFLYQKFVKEELKYLHVEPNPRQSTTDVFEKFAIENAPEQYVVDSPEVQLEKQVEESRMLMAMRKIAFHIKSSGYDSDLYVEEILKDEPLLERLRLLDLPLEKLLDMIKDDNKLVELYSYLNAKGFDVYQGEL